MNVLVLIILILFSGFFSASETALTRYRSNYLEKLEENKKHFRTLDLLRKWLKDPNEMLTGLLIGNNIVNILASSIATMLIVNYFGNSGKAVLIATILMTILILIFGEITPKLIASNKTAIIAESVIKIVYFLAFILKPFIYLLMLLSKLIGRLLGIEITTSGIMITEEDILSLVNVGKSEGIIEEDEKEMIHSIVSLGETTAKEVMTPRTSMTAFEGNKTIDEVWEQIINEGFSRIPVYDDTIDSIVGILYSKDLLQYLKDGKTDVAIKNVVRQPYYVPETKSIIEILKEFRKRKVHIAMVLDEYGGIVGLLTIEDLIEEIVGEIRDEFDNEEDFIKKLSNLSYKVDAMIDIETLNKELDIDLPISEDYETLGGLIIKELGRVCEVGDELNIDNINIKVIELDKMRVSQAIITLEEKEYNEED